jgi:hypothetical protein
MKKLENYQIPLSIKLKILGGTAGNRHQIQEETKTKQ